MFPKPIINEVPVLRWFNGEINNGGNTMNLEKAINEVKKLLEEASKNADNAACGYDNGWYCGEENAYETVLEILKKI